MRVLNEMCVVFTLVVRIDYFSLHAFSIFAISRIQNFRSCVFSVRPLLGAACGIVIMR